MTVICPHCQQAAVLVGGRVIYPHREDLYGRHFYLCVACDAYVGCHKGTTNALGTPANAELRAARKAAHQAFDPLWQTGKKMTRKRAYHWLANRLGVEEIHIGHSDVETCRKIVLICKGVRA